MSSKTFQVLSPDCWRCVQQSSTKEHGTVYDPPPPATEGLSTTSTVVGDVKLSFNYDAAQQTVSYTIVSKPLLVPESQIWSGIEASIQACAA